jgi:uncharacterized coiled-coil protein SlyX
MDEMTRDEWQKLAEKSANRAEAAGAFVEDRLGEDYHDDYFATAKLTLWVYEQHQENETLRAALAERDARIAHIREKVAYLYGRYANGEAFWTDEGAEIIVDAVWEARLFELDAMLTAPAATAEEKQDE